ncbi:MAG: AsmA family protein [Nitrospiraceae bacterium]|nr:AsmA family protein [Nitrospiraceae bacterium]
MKKLLYVIAAVIVVLIVLVAAASIFVKSYFTSDRLKTIVLPKIEAATGRKASIAQINISIFKGIIVKDISLKNSGGKTDFLKAGEFLLSYKFWPLLHKQLVISKLELDSPYVIVIREKNGKYNFSDIAARMKAQKPAAQAPAQKKAFPLAIEANSIVVRNAQAQFIDRLGALPNMEVAADARFGLQQAGTGYAVSGTLNIKSMKAVIGGLEADTSGKIDFNNDMTLALNTVIGNDKIAVTGAVKNYMKAPAATLNAKAATLNLDRIMAALGNMKKTSPSSAGKPAQKKGKAAAAPPSAATSKFTAGGRITVGAATYKGITFKDFLAVYRMAKGNFSLNPVSSGFQQGARADIAGSFKAVMSVSMADPKRTLNGNGQANLSKLKIKKSAITSQIASILQAPELAAPTFGTSRLNFSAAGGVITFNGSMLSQNMEINPIAGKLVLYNEALGAAFDLKLPPGVSARLPGGRYKAYLQNQSGWTVLPFVVKGTASKPAVSINQAALGKQAGKKIEQELKKRFLPGGGNQNTTLPGALKRLFQ